ncbi:MAG TPA: cytochrome c oxidase assembly protein [Acidimicrobiales bacterium]|nr:cytochrome c oxidase assembly protein [Acidimicrobiales bacterium]
MLFLSAAVAHPWKFTPHPDVWALILSLVAGYWTAIRYLGPHLAVDRPVVTRRQVTWFSVGVLLLWVSADWPIHDIAENYLFSMHMVEHTMYSLIVPPILLLGTPTWLLRWVVGPILPVVRRIARPLPAALMFNGVLALTHWPAWVDLTLHSESFHFFSHALLFATSFVMWLPVVNHDPSLPTLSPPAKMLYLFLQGIVPTVPAAFLIFADGVVYRFYATVPRLWGLTAVEDQQIAGAIMKVGGTMILWGTIVGVFFKWYSNSLKNPDRDELLTWEAVERELERTEPIKERVV